MTQIDLADLNKPRIIRQISLALDAADIIRLLGHHAKKTPSPKLIESIDTIRNLAYSLVNPKGVYCIFEASSLKEISSQISEHLAIAVVTIGPELENEVTKLNQTGRLQEATILDAFGSQFSENAAAYIQCLIDETIRGSILSSFHSTERKSPGYPGLPLELQKDIFHLLPAHEIEVTLNASCMMHPRKSISFLSNLESSDSSDKKKSKPCARCPLTHCSMRVSQRSY